MVILMVVEFLLGKSGTSAKETTQCLVLSTTKLAAFINMLEAKLEGRVDLQRQAGNKNIIRAH